MKKTVVLAAVSVCLLAASSAHAQTNLVLDGGFETGSLALWQAQIDTPTVVAGNAHSGTYALELGQSTSDASVQQTNLTLSAVPYVVDFWAENTGGHIGGFQFTGHLTVSLDGVQVAYFSPSVGTTYNEYTFTVTPTTSGALSFSWARGGGPNPLYLDDVSVTQVPEPTTMTIIAGALLLLPLRMLRKTRTA
jgi:hypothetical protein